MGALGLGQLQGSGHSRMQGNAACERRCSATRLCAHRCLCAHRVSTPPCARGGLLTAGLLHVLVMCPRRGSRQPLRSQEGPGQRLAAVNDCTKQPAGQPSVGPPPPLAAEPVGAGARAWGEAGGRRAGGCAAEECISAAGAVDAPLLLPLCAAAVRCGSTAVALPPQRCHARTLQLTRRQRRTKEIDQSSARA